MGAEVIRWTCAGCDEEQEVVACLTGTKPIDEDERRALTEYFRFLHLKRCPHERKPKPEQGWEAKRSR